MDTYENLIYKKVIDSYSINDYQDYNPIGQTAKDYYGTIYTLRDVPKYGHWIHINRRDVSEKEFKDNYGNNKVGVESVKQTIVIEKYPNKISLKLYSTYRARSVGSRFFRIRRELSFITYNLKFNNFYTGLINKKNKRIIGKRVRVNNFYNQPFSRISLEIRKVLRDSSLKNGGNTEVISNLTTINDFSDDIMFMFLNAIKEKCGVKVDIRGKDHEEKFFQLFLECNKFKYPNNYKEYLNLRIPKNLLKKNTNLSLLFMTVNSLSGKKIRKLLNCGTDLDFYKLVILYRILGVDYFNLVNDSVFSKNDLQYFDSFKVKEMDFDIKLSSTVKNKVVKVMNQGLRFSLLIDHLRMINELKEKHNYIFKIKFNTTDEFTNEHYDLSDLLQSYNTGIVNRNYGEDVKSVIEETISDLVGIEYYPKVLTNTNEYNEESQVQKNCVRTYSEKPNNIIISLRCNGIDSKVRATIEYRFSKTNIERVQSFGGKNNILGNMWNVPLEIIDERVKRLYNSRVLKLPTLIKEYKSGKSIERKSICVDGNVVWDNEMFYNDEIMDLPF